MAAEWRRLKLLENAIINYGGGMAQLRQRAETLALAREDLDPEANQLLTDIVRYLRDVARTGKLDTEPCHQHRYR